VEQLGTRGELLRKNSIARAFFGLRLEDKRFAKYFKKFAGTTVIDLRP
jgi:hypothetical protein